jgi:hypothetical protein
MKRLTDFWNNIARNGVENGKLKLESGKLKLETGNWKLEAGNLKLET